MSSHTQSTGQRGTRRALTKHRRGAVWKGRELSTHKDTFAFHSHSILRRKSCFGLFHFFNTKHWLSNCFTQNPRSEKHFVCLPESGGRVAVVTSHLPSHCPAPVTWKNLNPAHKISHLLHNDQAPDADSGQAHGHTLYLRVSHSIFKEKVQVLQPS